MMGGGLLCDGGRRCGGCEAPCALGRPSGEHDRRRHRVAATVGRINDAHRVARHLVLPEHAVRAWAQGYWQWAATGHRQPTNNNNWVKLSQIGSNLTLPQFDPIWPNAILHKSIKFVAFQLCHVAKQMTQLILQSVMQSIPVHAFVVTKTAAKDCSAKCY